MTERVTEQVQGRSRWLRWVVLALAGLWLVAWPWSLHHAVTAPWAPSGEVPTAAQVAEALSRLRVSAVLGVGLPVVTGVLAHRARMPLATVLMIVAAMTAGLASVVARALADAPTATALAGLTLG